MLKLLALPDASYTATINSTLVLLGIGGFLVAVVVGSIAWYNSKKPAGWEGAEKPDWVPDVEKTRGETTSEK
jgi:hypothetical protein